MAAKIGGEAEALGETTGSFAAEKATGLERAQRETPSTCLKDLAQRLPQKSRLLRGCRQELWPRFFSGIQCVPKENQCVYRGSSAFSVALQHFQHIFQHPGSLLRATGLLLCESSSIATVKQYQHNQL